MSVSRPKTVMNQGVPAASKCPSANSGTRIRSAARSASDRFHVWTRSSQPALSTGAERCQSVIDCSARRRSASSSRANDAAGSGATPSSSACTPTTSLQRAPGSSESANRATAVRLVERLREMDDGSRRRTRRPRRPASRCRAALRRVDRRQRLVAGSAETGSRLLDDEDVGEVGRELQPELDLDPALAVVLDDDPLLHAVADEALPLDRRARSAAGRRPAGLRSTNEARCGAGWSCERGSRRAPPSVSTERERKRVSEAKKPDAVARPSTSPRSSQTQNVEPSRTVRGKPTRLFRRLGRSPRRRAAPARAARRTSRSPLPATAARPAA